MLPDVRLQTGQRVGVDVQLGKTTATSIEDLIDRYAIIASQPEGAEARVREVLGRHGAEPRRCAARPSPSCRSWSGARSGPTVVAPCCVA